MYRRARVNVYAVWVQLRKIHQHSYPQIMWVSYFRSASNSRLRGDSCGAQKVPRRT